MASSNTASSAILRVAFTNNAITDVTLREQSVDDLDCAKLAKKVLTKVLPNLQKIEQFDVPAKFSLLVTPDTEEVGKVRFTIISDKPHHFRMTQDQIKQIFGEKIAGQLKQQVLPASTQAASTTGQTSPPSGKDQSELENKGDIIPPPPPKKPLIVDELIEPVKRDGNCLFRACGVRFRNDANSYPLMRAATVKWIRENYETDAVLRDHLYTNDVEFGERGSIKDYVDHAAAILELQQMSLLASLQSNEINMQQYEKFSAELVPPPPANKISKDVYLDMLSGNSFHGASAELYALSKMNATSIIVVRKRGSKVAAEYVQFCPELATQEKLPVVLVLEGSHFNLMSYQNFRKLYP